MFNDEQKTQMAVVEWFKIQYPKILITCAPAGVKRGSKLLRIKTGSEQKKMGYCKGWPDLQIARARHGFNGLFIEVKDKNGRLTDDQKVVFQILRDEGYRVDVCFSFDECLASINKYLKG